jgi:hypothetical protein
MTLLMVAVPVESAAKAVKEIRKMKRLRKRMGRKYNLARGKEKTEEFLPWA